MANEALTGARYPISSDAPAIWTIVENAVKDLAGFTIPRFTTTTTRDAAFTARGGTIANGSKCWTDADGEWTRIAGAWVITEPIAKPYFQGYRTAAQSIPNITDTVITWTGEYYDTNNAHAASGTTFIAPYTAYYRAQASVVFEANSTGYRQITIRRDGTNVNGTASLITPAQSVQAQPVHTPHRRIRLDAGQTLDVVVYQNSGVALNTTSGSGAFTSIFEVSWDGAV